MTTGTTAAPSRSVRIRPAHEADAPAIAEIYSQGIRGRGATFETAERSAGDVRPWLEPATMARHPCLVALDGAGNVIGWARASTYRERQCYATIGEFSVYVALEARGQRVGDALMAQFLPACEAAGLTKILSRVFPENAASLSLCARHGFRAVGTYEKHGKLDGQWRDVVIVERLLGEANT